MAQRGSSVGMADKAKVSFSSLDTNKKVYGAILSATIETAEEVMKNAISMKKLTNKPIMVIIGEGD